jgi:hypothetical protein
MPTQSTKDDDKGAAAAAPKAAARYKVLSSGISTATGAHYRDEVVSADDIGDAARVQKLLDKGAIEAV